jgi:hypothetical protein
MPKILNLTDEKKKERRNKQIAKGVKKHRGTEKGKANIEKQKLNDKMTKSNVKISKETAEKLDALGYKTREQAILSLLN